MNDYINNTIKNDSTIKDALILLNQLGSKTKLTLFVINQTNQLIGTLTDGDIRRALIAEKTLDDKVDDIIHKEFRYIELNSFYPKKIRQFRNDEIELVPILNKKKQIVKIIDLYDTISMLPVDAVIMAGGEGRRLSPLTTNTPKPLLKIGKKPIIEHLIDHMTKFDITNIYISINYLGYQIINYFKDGKEKGINIKYIEEKKPLGTIGAVSLIDDFLNDYILVINSDLLTNIDFEDFFMTFVESNADMAVASIPYKYKIPYATLETKNNCVTSFKEKPTHTYYTNAGIYLIKKEVLEMIPYNKVFNATDLMQTVVTKNKKLISFPILNYWLDIGKPEDYEKAIQDIEHLKL